MNVHLDEPIALLPLRLEIRRFDAGTTVPIADLQPDPNLADGHYKPYASDSAVSQVTIDENQYWIRWYPDDIELSVPVGKFTDEEKDAYRVFADLYRRRFGPNDANAAITWDVASILADEKIKRAYLVFADEVGPARARQMMKHDQYGHWEFDGDNPLAEPVEMAMQDGLAIPALPPAISIYAIVGGQVVEVQKDIVIHRDKIVVAAAEIEGSHWMTDFDEAERVGMGVRIKDPVGVARITAADWLLVVGADGDGDRRGVFEELLRRRSATGDLAIPAQDSPTNNMEGSTTSWTDLGGDALAYLRATSEPISPVPPNPLTVDAATQIEKWTTDAAVLTELFGLDPTTLGEIEGSGSRDGSAAAAMTTLLWNVCSAGLRDMWLTVFDAVRNDWTGIGSYFIETVRARSHMLRVDDKPYGILPVVDSRSWKPDPDLRPEETRVQSAIHGLCQFLTADFLRLAAEVPKLGNNGGDPFETFLDILRTTPVSSRIEARTFKAVNVYLATKLDPEHVTVPLVKDTPPAPAGGGVAPGPTEYLDEFAGLSVNDSLRIDSGSPVLKRLLAYFLFLMHDGVLPLTDSNLNARFPVMKTAARHLAQLKPEQLESLLLEFTDLFSHRFDALKSAPAYARLKKCRKASPQPPPIGVYGWLESPGDVVAAPQDARYLQAPSEAQANTLAIMMAGSANKEPGDPSEAFRVNLSSRRVREGTAYLNAIRHGYEPEEYLGMALEKSLRAAVDAGSIDGGVIHDLRAAYPLTLQDATDANGRRTSTPTIIHGERFIDAVEAGNEPGLISFADELKQIKDAAADLAVCEAVHHVTNGRGEAAAAWMDFLEGDERPPVAEFVSTVRTGDMHGTRLMLLLKPPSDMSPSGANPRVIADPVFAHMCASHMPDFELKQLVVSGKRLDRPELATTFLIPVTAIGLKPIDLVVGGDAELHRAARRYVYESVRSVDPNASTTSPAAVLGTALDFPTSEDLLSKLSVTLVEPAPDMPAANSDNVLSYRPAARLLNRLVHQGEGGKPAAVAPRDIPLLMETAAEQVQNIDREATFALLLGRLKAIETLVVTTERDFATPAVVVARRVDVLAGLIGLGEDARTCRKRLERGEPIDDIVTRMKTDATALRGGDANSLPAADADAVDAALLQIEAGGDTLAAIDAAEALFSDLASEWESHAMEAAADFVANTDIPWSTIDRLGAGAALIVFPDVPLLEDTLRMRELLARVAAGLAAKKASVSDAVALLETNNAPVEQRIADAVEALQSATDGPAVPVITPWFLTDPNGGRPQWDIDLSALYATTVKDRLEIFYPVRPAVDSFRKLVPETKAIYEDRRRQKDDPDDTSGTKLGDADYLFVSSSPRYQSPAFICLTVDEWREFIPQSTYAGFAGTDTESSGVAFHYPSPQAEAPCAILVAVPPVFDPNGDWTVDMLAEVLRETIELMQIRMVSSEQIVGDNDLGRYLPGLYFGDIDHKQLFPVASKPLHPYSVGSPFHYVLASQLSQTQLSTPDTVAARDVRPRQGGNDAE